MEEQFIKITNAVYGILDFLPDADPLKNKAKEKALMILENLTLVSVAEGWTSLKKEMASAQLLDDIEILINYLAVGKNQGWIDAMNFLIITKEYHAIKSGIKVPLGIIRQGLQMAELAKNKAMLTSFDKERLKENQPMVVDASPEKQIQWLERSPGDQTSLPRSKNNSEKQDQLLPKALARQGKILEMLSEKEKAQVSDFIKKLPNVTKRTVRRDLGDLLKQGKITRIGEWNQVFYHIV